MKFLQSIICGIGRTMKIGSSPELPHLAKQFHTTSRLSWDSFLLHRMLNWPRQYKSQLRDRKPIKRFNVMKGVVLKTVIKHPKKPNSGNRPCVLVRLWEGTECYAYVPGEGHNLQEHSQVLVRGGRRRDLVGVCANVVRGALDCAPVKKKTKTN